MPGRLSVEYRGLRVKLDPDAPVNFLPLDRSEPLARELAFETLAGLPRPERAGDEVAYPFFVDARKAQRPPIDGAGAGKSRLTLGADGDDHHGDAGQPGGRTLDSSLRLCSSFR